MAYGLSAQPSKECRCPRSGCVKKMCSYQILAFILLDL